MRFGGWWGTLILAILAAQTCPAFDLLDFSPNDLDPVDRPAASVALQPAVLARLAGRLSVNTLKPVAFTLSDGYDSGLAVERQPSVWIQRPWLPGLSSTGVEGKGGGA
jgi:hypothetical protein